jgi:hypothetical protein
MGKWSALIVLAAAQFLMVLDQSVMNVSISQLVADFDTNVTTIQAVITLYSLGLGDLWGRAGCSRSGWRSYASARCSPPSPGACRH